MKTVEFLALWFIFGILPIFVVWTIGLPMADSYFWFNDFGQSVSIAWFWLVPLLLTTF